MIYKLNRKFILISAVCIFAVILVIFGMITVLNINSMNRTLDDLTDNLSRGGGLFFDGPFHRPDRFGPEVRFSTRHFTVWLDDDQNPIFANTEFISSVDMDEAVDYAETALEEDQERGWIDHYRYKVYDTPIGTAVTFVDGSTNRAALYQSLGITFLVLIGAAGIVLLLITRISSPLLRRWE